MLLLIFSYISLFAFIYLSLSKAMKYAKMPMHGRLDLYPVPKEKGTGEFANRGHYGGSYFEDVKWWSKPREVSHVGELVEMLKEMLFIKKLFDNQRPLWWISYSLHLGIYLLIAWTVLLFVGAITEITGLAIDSSNWWSMLIFHATFFTGAIGALLAGFGASSLFMKRLFVENFKKYTTVQEYFNLLFIFIVVATGILVWAKDPMFNYGRHIAHSMLTFSPINADSVLATHIVLLGTLLIYIPLTKMSHYVGKYFSFHKVLWDNDPNLPGSQIEQTIKAGASFKPSKTWSAPHYQPTENKTKSM